jgi:hypothetical protein
VEKSSRNFDLCSATNGDFDHFRTSRAAVPFRSKRRVATSSRCIRSRALDFDNARYSLVFRTLRECARSHAGIDATNPGVAARSPPPPRRKKIRKVVDTKKMRG